MAVEVKFSLSFKGNFADANLIDFYDAAEALTGLQRSLALTTHLVLNGEIITQAPALKGAEILIKSPEAGSWKVIAIVGLISSGIHTLATAPRDTILGHLAVSAYDYVIKETLGFHVDFDSTLGQQYEQVKRQRNPIAPPVSQSQMDSLIEKTESSIKQIHRPIFGSKTALTGDIEARIKREIIPIQRIDAQTYDYINFTNQIEHPVNEIGRVTSYNINTFKGRIYLHSERRPIPFELAEGSRDAQSVIAVTDSLSVNARDRLDGAGDINVTAFRFESSTGRLKKILVAGVSPHAAHRALLAIA